jgi:short-subunit dehydrogenase
MATTAVVTGSARGIGFALADALAARGHRVLLTDLDLAAASAAAERIGRGAWALAQDVSDPGSHDGIAAAASQVGRLAVWVNNAGILDAGNCWEHKPGTAERIVNVNLLGVINGSCAAVRAMGSEGGSILNIASISALSPIPGLALYAASKAAVLSFTTSLQGDLRHAGLPITARALLPDVVNTAMVTEREHDPGAAMLFAGPQPLTPESIAAAGLELLDSHQVLRVVPRYRGVIARSAGLFPAVGLPTTALMRKAGDRRQRKS